MHEYDNDPTESHSQSVTSDSLNERVSVIITMRIGLTVPVSESESESGNHFLPADDDDDRSIEQQLTNWNSSILDHEPQHNEVAYIIRFYSPASISLPVVVN
jgi:hypothetical protein